jgi:hypothetical protein
MAKLITTRKTMENKVAILAFISRNELQSKGYRNPVFFTKFIKRREILRSRENLLYRYWHLLDNMPLSPVVIGDWRQQNKAMPPVGELLA